ncbi:MAG: o-succinylbenzoate synthase [Cytophagales bacterium]|nr:o-succinylbenzoate synthase [Cytophagales bacterium]
MLQLTYSKNKLQFKHPIRTSRGEMNTHDTYILRLTDEIHPDIYGLGEAAPLPGLSIDHLSDIDHVLSVLQQTLQAYDIDSFTKILPYLEDEYKLYPSVVFALQTAFYDLKIGQMGKVFASPFYDMYMPIPINGLVWMSNADTMLAQALDKINQGFTTIKIKVGALDFEEEYQLLAHIRKLYTADQLGIRLDANGAWLPSEVFEKLERLQKFDIHSIEQPLNAKYIEDTKKLCCKSIIAVALDEQLIGYKNLKEKAELLQYINPQYIVLKPTLLGGYSQCNEYISTAEKLGIGWWLTSALESNIGLCAIAQYCSLQDIVLPQGLGTGGLYVNNFEPEMRIQNGMLVRV